MSSSGNIVFDAAKLVRDRGKLFYSFRPTRALCPSRKRINERMTKPIGGLMTTIERSYAIRERRCVGVHASRSSRYARCSKLRGFSPERCSALPEWKVSATVRVRVTRRRALTDAKSRHAVGTGGRQSPSFRDRTRRCRSFITAGTAHPPVFTLDVVYEYVAHVNTSVDENTSAHTRTRAQPTRRSR